MALSKIGSGESFDDLGDSWTSTALTKDTGTAVGDLAVIMVSWYENASSTQLTTPTGFTDHGSVVVSSTGDTESRIDVFSRVIDGTEGATFTVDRGAAAMYATAQLITLRGSSALSVASVTAGTPAAGVTSVAAPSVSGTNGQGFVAAYAVTDPAGTYTGPGGMTLGISEGSETTNTGRIYFETLSATGATGTRTLSWTNTRDAIGVSILVNGADAGGGGQTANPTGTAGTGGVGTVAASGAANKAVTGVSAAGSIGTITVQGADVATTLTGVAGTSAVGALSTIVTVAPVGVGAAGSAGTVTQTHGGLVALTGVQGTGATGALAPPVHFTLTLDEGVEATGSVGTLSQTHGSTVVLTGLAASGLIGSVNASGSGSVNVNLSGVQATAAVGTLAVSADASTVLTGVNGTAAIGSLLATGAAIQSLTGVSSTGSAGTVQAIAPQANASPTGVSAPGQVGSITISYGSTIGLDGVSATGSIGTLTAGSGVTFVPEQRTIRVSYQSRTIRL